MGTSVHTGKSPASIVQLSPAAIAEILRLRSKQAQNPDMQFRLSVQPGGCADFYYKMEFITSLEINDQVYHWGGLEVVVDDLSLQQLQGLLIDYSEDLMGGGFRFHNPNATKSCGCGNSFALR
jgi:iron-sulfur cluster assembly protein